MKTIVLCAFVAVLGVANAHLKDCPEFCPEDYKPVCGSNGQTKQTFGNECKMLQFNCLRSGRFNILKYSDCEHSDRLGTKEIIPGFIPGLEDCPDVWMPVCGSDGSQSKTFPNECIMNVLNRLDDKKYRAMRSGPCNESDLPKSLRKDPADCGMCVQVYQPLCATDGYQIRTFGNSCMMKVHNCLEHRSFVQTRSGECL